MILAAQTANGCRRRAVLHGWGMLLSPLPPSFVPEDPGRSNWDASQWGGDIGDLRRLRCAPGQIRQIKTMHQQTKGLYSMAVSGALLGLVFIPDVFTLVDVVSAALENIVECIVLALCEEVRLEVAPRRRHFSM